MGEWSGGSCEVQVLGVCAGVGAEWQHRKARSRGGEWNPANGLMACSQCQAWIHEHPTAAEEAGWTVRAEDDPTAVPVEYPCWGRVVLDDHGSIHLVQRGQTA